MGLNELLHFLEARDDKARITSGMVYLGAMRRSADFAMNRAAIPLGIRMYP